METFEEIKRYLPAYLSADSYTKIIEELKSYPDNIDARFYSLSLVDPDPLQGDGIPSLPVINFPSHEIRNIPCILLSNSCDVSKDNIRNIPTTAVYAPILKLNKLEKHLRAIPGKSDYQINDILEAIRKQKYSNIFYLPAGYINKEEQFVFLDKLCHCDINYLNENCRSYSFRLSNYGFYVLIMKIAIHFTRMQEGVDRC